CVVSTLILPAWSIRLASGLYQAPSPSATTPGIMCEGVIISAQPESTGKISESLAWRGVESN
ncbi:MAG: hypothetical protein E7I31_11295, partial [Staphylococcus lugdunensis]|nr:hypothetical protein [Staphylococcus lugdunensis]